MDTLNTFKRAALATVVAASLTGLAGCEWDNSDEWESNGTSAESPSNGSGGGSGGGNSGGSDGGTTGENDGDTQGPKISGTLTTSSPLEGSTLCLDTNDNQQCDDGEPSAVPDEQGNWEINLGEDGAITEDTRVVFVPETTTPTLIGTAKPGYSGGDITDVQVSMISTLIEQERKRLEALGVSDPEGEAYIAIAEQLGTSPEELKAYLDPNNDYGYTISPSERDRLERVDQLTGELATQIDESIPPGEKANLTPEEINDLITDQISDNMPAVVDEVDKSQVTHPEDEDFQDILDNVTSNPAFDEALTPPETTKTSEEAQLEQRIEQALSEETDSNYFRESGFERLPVVGADSTTYDVELLPTGNTLPGSPVVYYEARQRVTVDVENGETAITDLNIIIPKQNDLGDIRPVPLEDQYWWSYFESGNYCDVPACDDLRVRPQTINTHKWEIQSFQKATIKLGQTDRIYMTAVNNNGTVVASNRNTGFTSDMTYHPFNLNGLSIRTVVKELYGIDLPTKAEAGIDDPEIPETIVFDSGTSAADETLGYAFSERTAMEALMTNWGPGGTRDNNTNRVYGESGSAARTLGDLMYATRTPYAGPNPTLPDSPIRNAIQLSGPTGEVYVARLIGQASAEEGTIAIDRFNEATQQWEAVKPMGTWKKEPFPFPRVDLNLPGGFRYTEANPGLRLGEAYLYEYIDGYVHHGWRLPPEADVATLLGRRKVNYVLSTGAFNQLTEGLEALGLLQRHPSDVPEPEPEDTGGY